jgi:hypothetical protein
MTYDLRISIDEVRKRLAVGERFTFIDTRNPQAWAESDVTVPGALRITADTLDQNLSRIPRGTPIVTYCT